MSFQVHCGDSRRVLDALPAETFDAIVTSPPYFGVRDYGSPDQVGLEPTVSEYVAEVSSILNAAGRLLRSDGTLWLNVADVYGGGGIARPSGKWPTAHDPADRNNGKRRSFAQEKCLLGVPDLLAGAMVEAGWVLRNRIVWIKDRPVPSNAADRLDSQYEFVYLLVKRDGRRPNYRFTKPLSDRGDVWMIPVRKASQVHYATFPVELAERCLSHVARPGLRVLDPFSGSGTTGVAALNIGGSYVGVEINPEFAEESRERLRNHRSTLFDVDREMA